MDIDKNLPYFKYKNSKNLYKKYLTELEESSGCLEIRKNKLNIILKGIYIKWELLSILKEEIFRKITLSNCKSFNENDINILSYHGFYYTKNNNIRCFSCGYVEEIGVLNKDNILKYHFVNSNFCPHLIKIYKDKKLDDEFLIMKNKDNEYLQNKDKKLDDEFLIMKKKDNEYLQNKDIKIDKYLNYNYKNVLDIFFKRGFYIPDNYEIGVNIIYFKCHTCDIELIFDLGRSYIETFKNIKKWIWKEHIIKCFNKNKNCNFINKKKDIKFITRIIYDYITISKRHIFNKCEFILKLLDLEDNSLLYKTINKSICDNDISIVDEELILVKLLLHFRLEFIKDLKDYDLSLNSIDILNLRNNKNTIKEILEIPLHEDFKDVEERRLSIVNSNKYSDEDSKKFAELGFFYYEGSLICFFCNYCLEEGILNLKINHLQNSRRCEYIISLFNKGEINLLNKIEIYIKKNNDFFRNYDKREIYIVLENYFKNGLYLDINTLKDIFLDISISGIKTNSSDEIENISNECIICNEIFKNNSRITIIPCGHTSVCSDCFYKIYQKSILEMEEFKCPLCRIQIQRSIIPIF